MNFFNLSLQLKGFPIKKAKQDFAEIQSQSEDEFIAYIQNKKRQILEYHLNNNPFYKNFVKGADLSDWNSIPIIHKSDLQIPLAQRLSTGFTTKNCHLHKTSGSSGTPLIFAKDKYCHALTWANFMDRYALFGIDVETSKQARFYGMPLSGNGHYKERLKDKLGNRHRFSVFDLSDDTFERNIHQFEKTAFDYINGYTSTIVLFAKYLEKKEVVLKTICPSLKVCIVTAEMLFEADKVLLEKQLGVPIINEYGSAELGLIAFNNPQGEWQVNTQDLFVEILDENDLPVPIGKEGRVVITSLYNLAHPFIRYDIGDIGSIAPSSSIQKPILQSLMGRTSDVVKLPSGKTAAGLTFYYVTKTIIEDDADVKEFVIDQLTLDTFKITYVSSDNLSTEKTKAIHQAVENYLEPGLTIHLNRTNKLERTSYGKLKQFTSHLT
ncbi:phenylacetate--CoA ligase family protein [Hyunsoonleella sp. SJ7]|uniref:Phenylacetate--CoA ligase family protein n=1 Tax=Hyunsoonleella aquatilis TaxID=2762758 RepID=A0A923HA30_9FLAO|nr:phenylacetate--CoA ligase family protein [Hyunsoonleella aquatilis]